MPPKIMDAGDANPLLKVPKLGSWCLAKVPNKAPPAPYGDAGLIVGHRHPKKHVVANIPKMPIKDMGANELSDCKLQRGSKVVEVTNNTQKGRDAATPESPLDAAKA